MSEFCRWRRNEGYEACADDMEGAAAHPVPARPDSKMPGSLLGGNRLFHSFKNIQIGKSSENKKSACHSHKENGKRRLVGSIFNFHMGKARLGVSNKFPFGFQAIPLLLSLVLFAQEKSPFFLR